MHPGRDRDRADAMRKDDDVLQRETVVIRNVAHERVYIFHHGSDVLRGASLARRAAVASRIPCKNRYVAEVEHFHNFRPTAGMCPVSSGRSGDRAVGRRGHGLQ